METIKQRFAEHITLAQQVAEKQNFRAGCSQCGNYSTGLAKRQEGFVLRQRRQCRRQSAFSG